MYTITIVECFHIKLLTEKRVINHSVLLILGSLHELSMVRTYRPFEDARREAGHIHLPLMGTTSLDLAT